ncbi:MAG: lytic transglycosylase domain-containing protein [Oscillospiraceae bacterium]|nr:lytic transglycosylase domain-containing protein [Oscillospiraceae bacterium]
MRTNKAIKNTVAIMIMIAVSVGLGYAYDKISNWFEKRSHPLEYTEIVEKYSEEYSVPKEMVFGVIKAESGFRSDVVSSAGAVGLMQITEVTFDWLTARMGENLSKGLLYDPETNIKYGTYYLGYLYKEFGNWDIVLAAYNAGPNKVKNNWLNNPEYIIENEIVYIPIEETRTYIQRVNKNRETYKRLYFSG